MANENAASKAIALVRMATSFFFLFFGEYKVAGPAFAHGGFQKYLGEYIANTAVHAFRPFLANVVLPHAVFFGYMVGVVELLIGLSLLFGLWVRLWSAVGIVYMVLLTLATWWDPGYGVPWWHYFGNELSHIPLLLLFVIFYATDAGRTWGLDSRRR
jgi:thiosulfate dehydrogenase [quinone] large subunit